jgi:hypothetical protein
MFSSQLLEVVRELLRVEGTITLELQLVAVQVDSDLMLGIRFDTIEAKPFDDLCRSAR